MTSSVLNILAMNHSIRLMEDIKAEMWENSKPIAKKEVIHYWHIEKKSRRGKKWTFANRFYCTDQQMYDTWTKFYRDGDESYVYRVVYMMSYPE